MIAIDPLSLRVCAIRSPRCFSSIPAHPIRSIMIANLVFGGIHLANLYGSRFSREYIALQVCASQPIGQFLSV